MRGFTLVELLVVLGIMSLVGLVAVVNFRTFGEDEALKGATLDLQTALRKVQNNAQTSATCQNNQGNLQTYSFWDIGVYKESGVSKFSAYCEVTDQNPGPQRISQLPGNIVWERICGNSLDCPSSASCQYNFADSNSIVVRFKPLLGQVSFFGGPNACFNNVSTMTVILKNTKTNNFKKVVIDQGGRIYVE